MALDWKQSAESATASQRKVFLWARLKLTGIYVLILAVIILGFSLVLYRSFAHNISDASEEDFSGIQSHQRFVRSTLENITHEILLIDLIVLAFAALASYLLAGYTIGPIQRVLEAQRKFSENASHELRTPLAVMRNDIEVLLRDQNPSKERVREVLESNAEEIKRLSDMAKDLLLLARSENQVRETPENIDITAITKSVAEKMKVIAKSKNIKLDLKLHQSLIIVGSAHEFERVITNLLKNAIEHTPAGGSITIETKSQEKEAIVTIADTGSGIDEKDLPHIFERFYKGEGTVGNGLGLSIVKELVEQHGGEIAITSARNKGTTATVRLPLA